MGAVSTNQEFQRVQRDPLKHPKAPETGLFYACNTHVDSLASAELEKHGYLCLKAYQDDFEFPSACPHRPIHDLGGVTL